jgi:hypothetical protein
VVKYIRRGPTVLGRAFTSRPGRGDFFQQNVGRIVDDVISQFHASLEIWPTLVEICYFQKDKRDLPQIKVKNKKIKAGIHAPM